jgi:hypothetical protein
VLAALALAPAALAQTPPPAAPTLQSPGPLPGPPPTVADLAYDARLLSSAAAAERFQGPLDGPWVLLAAQGELYAFQLTDKQGHVEGAWRDLRRPGDPAASGFLDQVRRTPMNLTLAFTPPGQAPVTVALGPNLRGQAEQGGRRFPVGLRPGAP